MSLLPWYLLANVLLVRFLLAKKIRSAFWLDLASVIPWIIYYYNNGDWQLVAIPLILGYWDIKALRSWWNE
jgi:hypothetical protein